MKCGWGTSAFIIIISRLDFGLFDQLSSRYAMSTASQRVLFALPHNGHAASHSEFIHDFLHGLLLGPARRLAEKGEKQGVAVRLPRRCHCGGMDEPAMHFFGQHQLSIHAAAHRLRLPSKAVGGYSCLNGALGKFQPANARAIADDWFHDEAEAQKGATRVHAGGVAQSSLPLIFF